MCGIAGAVHFHQGITPHLPLVTRMLDRLAHRGPDARGLWYATEAALASARLIVVDPGGGAQPMVRTRHGRTWAITYNGELYNTQELRESLRRRGYTFATHSDTEVVLVAYIAFGPACLERLNGMFAFAVYDSGEHCLFLARDRLGIKPLFYAEVGGLLLFASEMKALLLHPEVSATVGADGLAELLLQYPARTPGHAIYQAIREVRPGWCVRVRAAGLEERQYWCLPTQDHGDDGPATVQRVRELLTAAVQRQLGADVPVCTLLSGGLDSSAVTVLAAPGLRSAGTGPLRTYSVDFDANAAHFVPNAFNVARDEPFVQTVAAWLESEHTTVQVTTADVMRELGTVVTARDLPGLGDLDAALYLLCQHVKTQATVALSGEGADELFGGYRWAMQPEPPAFPWFPWAMGAYFTRLLRPDILDWMKPEHYLRAAYEQALAEVPPSPLADPQEQRARTQLYLLLSRFLPSLLERKDRMSMAASVEVRVPFCDQLLVEYVWNVPWAIKGADDEAKGLLRRAMAGVLPDAICQRAKNPFPSSHDPALVDAVRATIRQTLAEATAPVWQVFHRPATAAVVGRPWTTAPYFYLNCLLLIVQTDIWMRQYRVTLA